ncbi:hypothetical protein [Enhydrobacter aerosaccus]|nr:hypothetical protein [Enhydrobacter aerosaccus]
MYGTIIEGLSRRPGGDHVTTFAGLTNPVAHHWFLRDANNRFKIVVDGGQLKIWDFNGSLRTVTAPDGWDYISGASSLGFVTIKDYTFIWDRGKTVQMTTDVEPQENSAAVVWLRQGNYNTQYTVNVGYPANAPTWYSASYITSATDSGTIKLTSIISQLYGSLSLPAGFSKGYVNNSLLINRADQQDFIVTVSDNATGQDIVAVRSSVEKTTDLPTIALVGQHVTIKGDLTSDIDDWYARFVPTSPTGTGLQPGGWQESAKPGTSTTFDASTMPHVLTFNADGTFTFRKATWGTRVAGDETNDPKPSFVGAQITDIRAIKGRLGLLTSVGTMVCSRPDDEFNFWIKSAQQLTDGDPIDIAPDYPKSFVLKGAAEFQAGLVLLADEVQFLVTDGGTFGPLTVATKPLSAYNLQVQNGLLPLQQDRIVCALKRTNSTGLQSFLAPTGSLASMVFDEASAEVPTLLPGNVEWIAGSSTENVVVIKVDGDSNRLYVYKESTDSGKVIQSAWIPWRFINRTPIAGTFIDADFYVVLRDSNNVYTMERYSLRPFERDQITWPIYLDRRVALTTDAFTAVGGSTTVTLPWTATLGEDVYYVPTQGPQAGAVFKASAKGPNSATFPGLFSGPGVVGVGAPSFATVGTLYWRKYIMGGGIENVTNGVLQILRGKVSYAESGPFFINVIHTDRADPFQELVGVPLFGDGGYQSPLDLLGGSQDFPVGQINDRVKIQFSSGESPMPMRIGSFEWVGDMNLTARPL